MGGQVNSWSQTMTSKSSPCLGDTIGQSTGGEITNTGDEQQPSDVLTNCFWWIVGSLVVGYILRGKRS